MKHKLAFSNPVKGVALPKPDVIKIRFLRQSEIDCLLQVIEQDDDPLFKSLILAYLHTGARRYELLKPQFTWANVDFDECRIMLKGKGHRTRYVPMNNTLVNIFTELRKEREDPPFPYHPDTVTHRTSHYLKLAGIEGANLHSLRKTFGSLLLQNRLADLYTVSRLLGHSTIKTTERYYVDLLDENYRAPVMGLDSIITG
jgi:integrase